MWGLENVGGTLDSGTLDRAWVSGSQGLKGSWENPRVGEGEVPERRPLGPGNRGWGSP